MAMAKATVSSSQRILQRLLEDIDGASAGLAHGRPDDQSVHDIRKKLKHARAALRLLRKALGASSYRQSNRLLRDVARPLTPVRDSLVLRKALGSLDGEIDGLPQLVRTLRMRLSEEQAVAQRALDARTRRRLVARLAAGRRRLERQAAHLRPASLCSALERAYRRARTAFRRAERAPSDTRLHEWRKQSKYLLHQLELIEGVREAGFARLRRRADRIGRELGDDHDLAVLAVRLRETPSPASATAAMSGLVRLIDRRRQGLQRKARRHSRRLFQARPRRLRRRAQKALRG